MARQQSFDTFFRAATRALASHAGAIAALIAFAPVAASALPAGIMLELELARSGAELVEVVTSERLNPARCED
jgi:hypothetical protein